ncbi:MAG: hypothetical protein Kow00103_14760 [Candidatus Caldatribacteriota bacterium]
MFLPFSLKIKDNIKYKKYITAVLEELDTDEGSGTCTCFKKVFFL